MIGRVIEGLTKRKEKEREKERLRQAFAALAVAQADFDSTISCPLGQRPSH